MSERAKIRLTLSPQAERYVRQDAPIDVRRMAAGGALPLPPIEPLRASLSKGVENAVVVCFMMSPMLQ